MSRQSDNRRKRRHENRALGLCANGARHGPVVAQGKCAPCAEKQNAATRRAYYRRKESGVCIEAPSHGPATDGMRCGPCGAVQRERHWKAWQEIRKRKADAKRVKTCAFGASHGPAVKGIWCEQCVARRAAASERIAVRNITKMAQEVQTEQPKAQGLSKKTRYEELRGNIERTGRMDSTGLIDLLLQ
jgi:hypothetical protein